MGGLFGGGGGGGGDGGAAETTRRMNQYIADTKVDNERLLEAVRDIASGLEGEVKTRSDEFLSAMSSEEKVALDRLERANNWLVDESNALSDTFSRDVRQVLDDLSAATTLLDAEERDQIASRINQYRGEAEKIDADLRQTIESSIGRYDTDTRASIADFDARSMGLGDTFLDSARRAFADFGSTMDEATSLTPERLNLFTQAADLISRESQRTRQTLIESADPNYRQMRDQVDAITAANLDGRIDADTAANLARSAAFRSLAGGFSGSEMQRNLEARDLGLTALDLQSRGLSTFANESQRRFNTEVAGLQADPTALLRDNQSLLQSRANTQLDRSLSTAESDRNQRQSVLNAATSADLTRLNVRRGDEMNLGFNLADSAMNRARETTGMDVANIQNYSANRRNLLGTQFNTGLNAAGRLFDVGLATTSGLYNTNINAASNFYSTNANTFGTVYGTRTNAAGTAAQMNANAQAQAAANLAAVRGGANAQIERAYQQEAILANQRVADNNQMWGSIFNMGTSALGGFMGGGGGGMGGGGNIFGGMFNSRQNYQPSAPAGWSPNSGVDWFNYSANR